MAQNESWSPTATGNGYPDPFNDYASRVVPTNIRQAHRFCQGLFYYNPLVRETARRVLSVFLTEVELKGADNNTLDDTERNKYMQFLDKKIKIYQRTHEQLLDYLCVGNSFAALFVPPKRFLYCKECQKKGRYVEYPISRIMREHQFKFRWELPKFFAHCSKCERSTEWGRQDRRGNGDDAVLLRYATSEIDIRYDEQRDYREYVWLIPSTYRKKVKRGDPQILESVPWEVVEAVECDGNILFDKDYIYHMYEPTLSGMEHQGWGIPRVLVNARLAYLFQVYMRQNEAIALDYITPMRFVTPDVSASSDAEAGDPLASLDMGELRYEYEEAVRQHRIDPATWHFASHPLRYTVMGGDASQFATPELINQVADMLLNAMGFPSALFRAELDQNMVMPALRLFQSYWTHMVRYANGFIDWTLSRLSEEKGWDPVTGSLVAPTLMDDVQLIMAKLQMAQSGDMSKTTASRSVGSSYRAELEQQADEERLRTKIQEQLQKEQEEAGNLGNVAAQMQQQQQGGDPSQQPAGAQAPPAPAGAGAPGQAMPQGMAILPNQNITPDALVAQANQVAGELLGKSEGERQSAMTKMKATNPTLHMAVKAELDRIRKDARNQGGSQVLQQQYGGG